ncbi:MAG: hypothetical protein ACLFUU_11090 [Desulfobacteraceae bacterium]
MPPSPAEIREENRKLAYLSFLVDQALRLIRSGEVSHEQAGKMVSNIRTQALILFPGKEAVFDLIYQPRFQRAITETYRLH